MRELLATSSVPAAFSEFAPCLKGRAWRELSRKMLVVAAAATPLGGDYAGGSGGASAAKGLQRYQQLVRGQR